MLATKPIRIGYFSTICLLSVAFGLSWWAGGRGFQPVESSMVFDGGWRILSGQLPYKDFVAPTVLSFYLQALFFKLLGVNLWAYRMHAAVVNVCVTGLVIAILRVLLSTSAGLIKVGALLTAIWFYAFLGIPSDFQTSIFLGLCGIAVILYARQSQNSWRGYGRDSIFSPVFFAAPLMGLAFLAHPTSGAPFVVLPFFLLATPPWPAKWWQALIDYTVGLAASALLLFGILSYFTDLSLFKHYALLLPLLDSLHIEPDLNSLLPFMAAMVLLCFWVLVPLLWRLGRRPQEREALWLPLICFLAILSFQVIQLVLAGPASYAKFPLMGLLLVLAYELANGSWRSLLGSKKWYIRWLLRTLSLVMVLVILLALGGGVYLAMLPRAKGHTAQQTLAKAIDREPLKGLRWTEPSGITRQNVLEVTDFVRSMPDAIFVWSGFTILYGLGGHISVAPVVGDPAHAGLANGSGTEQRALDLWTLARLQAFNPQYVIGPQKLLLYDDPAFPETMKYLNGHFAYEHERFGTALAVFKRMPGL